MKWEYRVYLINAKPEITENIFKPIGEAGYELVSVDNGFAYFKRPLKNVSGPKIKHQPKTVITKL